MNYLQLCQRFVRECGISGTLSTVSGQSGEMLRVADWVGQAWLELQSKHDDWEWMRSSGLLGAGASFTTVAGTFVYPLGVGTGKTGVDPAVFNKWDRATFRCYTTAAGKNDEMPLDLVGYDAWRDAYMMGAMRLVQTRPVAIAVAPDLSLCVGPPPTAGYTVTGDYFRAPVAMTADGDLPTGLPSQFHMAIVYLAMTYYAGYEAAPEVIDRGQVGYAKLVAQLEALRAPEIGMVGALA